MGKERKDGFFAANNERVDDANAAEIARRIPGVRVEAETFVIPVHDKDGTLVANTHFMRHRTIPWAPTHGSIKIEDCLIATAAYGLEIHRGEMTLYEAVQKIRAERQ